METLDEKKIQQNREKKRTTDPVCFLGPLCDLIVNVGLFFCCLCKRCSVGSVGPRDDDDEDALSLH